MNFKKTNLVPIVFALLISPIANSSDLNAIKQGIVKDYSRLVPDCVNIVDAQLPDDFVDFVNKCHGSIETTVKKRMYDISRPEITSKCPDFEGDEFRSNISILGNATVIVAKRKLKSSTILDSSMLGFKNVSILELKGGVLCKSPSNYGYTLKRNVRTNDVLYESYIRQSYAIKRQQIVNVDAETPNGIKVSTQAKATSNAYINDVVNVLSLSSHRTFKVRVVGYNKVEVI